MATVPPKKTRVRMSEAEQQMILAKRPEKFAVKGDVVKPVPSQGHVFLSDDMPKRPEGDVPSEPAPEEGIILVPDTPDQQTHLDAPTMPRKKAINVFASSPLAHKTGMKLPAGSQSEPDDAPLERRNLFAEYAYNAPGSVKDLGVSEKASPSSHVSDSSPAPLSPKYEVFVGAERCQECKDTGHHSCMVGASEYKGLNVWARMVRENGPEVSRPRIGRCRACSAIPESRCMFPILETVIGKDFNPLNLGRSILDLEEEARRSTLHDQVSQELRTIPDIPEVISKAPTSVKVTPSSSADCASERVVSPTPTRRRTSPGESVKVHTIKMPASQSKTYRPAPPGSKLHASHKRSSAHSSPAPVVAPAPQMSELQVRTICTRIATALHAVANIFELSCDEDEPPAPKKRKL